MSVGGCWDRIPGLDHQINQIRYSARVDPEAVREFGDGSRGSVDFVEDLESWASQTGSGQTQCGAVVHELGDVEDEVEKSFGDSAASNEEVGVGR